MHYFLCGAKDIIGCAKRQAILGSDRNLSVTAGVTDAPIISNLTKSFLWLCSLHILSSPVTPSFISKPVLSAYREGTKSFPF
jgi:hypothetical protein